MSKANARTDAERTNRGKTNHPSLQRICSSSLCPNRSQEIHAGRRPRTRAALHGWRERRKVALFLGCVKKDEGGRGGADNGSFLGKFRAMIKHGGSIRARELDGGSRRTRGSGGRRRPRDLVGRRLQTIATICNLQYLQKGTKLGAYI